MWVLLLGCVTVKPYGPGPDPGIKPDQPAVTVQPDTPAAPQVDWAPYEAELQALLEEGGVREQDQLDRLDAAHSLTLALQDGAPPEQAVADYLDQLLVIEAREADQDMEVFDTGLIIDTGGVIEQDLPDTVPSKLEQVRADARTALAEARYTDAMASLEVHRDGPDWGELEPLWLEAVDGFVHDERERAGQMFMRARELPEGPEKQDQIRQVETLLVGLVTFYPESSYTDAIRENLELVRAELD